MAKQLVDTGGFVLLGTSGGGSQLFDGTQVKQASLTLTLTTATAQSIGEAYADEAVTRKSFELSGTAYYQSERGLFAVGDTCFATYYSQSLDTGGELDQVLFQGKVVVTKVADTQNQGDWETQEIALRSTGHPTIPAPPTP